MISFVWDEPSSVLHSMVFVGTLIEVRDDAVIVKRRDDVRSDELERVEAALRKGGKIERDARPGCVKVPRRGISRLVAYPPG